MFIFILGESLRRCLGGENEMVRWDVPDFSSCTSIEFRDLHEKVRQVLSFSYFRYFRELADGRESSQLVEKLIRLIYLHTSMKETNYLNGFLIFVLGQTVQKPSSGKTSLGSDRSQSRHQACGSAEKTSDFNLRAHIS